MKAGFAKFDITPRVGVSMAGFGPFLNRNSTFVRDRLEARAAALGLPAYLAGQVQFAYADFGALLALTFAQYASIGVPS